MKEQFTISLNMKLERKDSLLERKILFLVKEGRTITRVSANFRRQWGKKTNKSKELK